MKVISKQVDADKVINEYFIKLSKEEIIDDDLIDKEQLRNDYGNSYERVLEEINRRFRRMKGRSFEAKYINKEYLKDCSKLILSIFVSSVYNLLINGKITYW